VRYVSAFLIASLSSSAESYHHTASNKPAFVFCQCVLKILILCRRICGKSDKLIYCTFQELSSPTLNCARSELNGTHRLLLCRLRSNKIQTLKILYWQPILTSLISMNCYLMIIKNFTHSKCHLKLT
jgi:hypothetical protein